MKKVFAILVTLFFINCCYAQVRFGLKVGGNLANVDGFDQSKMKIGINAGPALQINLAKMFFLQSELLYSIKGARAEATQSNSDTKLSLNYINLPILFGYRAQNFAIKLGPEIGRLLSAKSKMDGSTIDYSEFYKDFDFGADLGVAYTFKKLAIDLRYNYGLGDLLNDVPSDQNASNRVLQFSLCYFIK